MSTTLPQKRFYVYTLAHPNGRIFYVGKGSGSRTRGHFTEARRGTCICDKCKMIQQIWKERLEVRVEYVLETDNEKEAFAKERETIDHLQHRYPLCNTNGNLIHTPRKASRAMGLSLAEYKEHLSYYNLSKREYLDHIQEYGALRIVGLEKAWRQARREHRWDDANQLANEIEMLGTATGCVLQLSLPFDVKKKRRGW